MKRVYKEPNKSETETTINVLYKEKVIIVYTNNISLQKQILKELGKPKEEFIKGKSILGSVRQIGFEEKSKITRMMLKTNLFELGILQK